MPSVLFQLAGSLRPGLLALADGHQQRAVAGFLRALAMSGLAVEQDVFVGRQALHHHAGLGQGGGVDLRGG
jgi:hypothetical protein